MKRVNWKEKNEKKTGKTMRKKVHLCTREDKKAQGTNPFSNESYINNNTI